MRRIFSLLCGMMLLCSVLLKSQTSATDSILHHWLEPQIVNSNKPVANTFYLWTTSAELDTCLRQNQLLRRVQFRICDEFFYADEIRYRAVKQNAPIANHLMSGERQRVLAAWPCYWATMSAWDRDYLQNQLVEVVLMDSSLIVSFFPDEKKSKVWRVHDLKGNELTLEQALQRKRHIAAVYMCNEEKLVFTHIRRTVYRTHDRNFFLCNESMIKSWHHATPGLQAKVQKDFDYLVLLNAWFEKPEHCAEQGSKGRVCYAAWTAQPATMQVSDLFFATQINASYLSVPANQETTKAIVEELRTRFRAQQRPCERFPAAQY